LNSSTNRKNPEKMSEVETSPLNENEDISESVQKLCVLFQQIKTDGKEKLESLEKLINYAKVIPNLSSKCNLGEVTKWFYLF
jgi:hypothetical protein